ncbi:MAG: MerR family DNA-binding transcriptional regulator [Candidatus Paceibacterota bacterium]|jgi:DNA (cytosine-5)-methyltransferase 1
MPSKEIPVKILNVSVSKDKRFLTVKEVAKLFGVTALTIRNWDKAGKLTAIRNPINNYRVYRAQDIEIFLRRMEKEGKTFLG